MTSNHAVVVGKAFTVAWTFNFLEKDDDRRWSEPFLFRNERLHLAFIFNRAPSLCSFILRQVGHQGRPSPIRPFRLTLSAEGGGGAGPYVTLARGTVSGVPWRREFSADSLRAQYSPSHDQRRWKEARLICLFEGDSFEKDSWAQTEIAGLTSEDAFPTDLDSLSLDLANLLKNETLPDVKLKCGSNRAIPAHRAVLAARSEVFAAMFRNEMAESRTGEVDLVDVDNDVIDPFLQYVYSGQIPSGVPDEVLPRLYATADKYAVHSLKETCRDRMVDLLTEENCVNFLTVADAHSDINFKKLVVSFICSHSAVFRSDSWLDFAKKPTPLAIEVYQSFIVRKASTSRLDDIPE